jgi:aminoglycoside phosphotransferase (APT) family kinase protein
LQLESADGADTEVVVVAKRASEAEIVALRAVAQMPGPEAFTEVIGTGIDRHGPWVVTPFYPGQAQAWDAEPAEQVYESLARLHFRYRDTAAELPAVLPRVDAAFCLGALTDFAPTGLARAQRAQPHPLYERALTRLAGWADDDRIYAGVRLFQPTLLHGDVYGSNILMPVADQGLPRLVDWGSTRIGPAMLDVALAADRQSAGFAAYRRAWQAAAGTPLNHWQAEAEHAWARAFTSAMFIGAVADRFGPDGAAQMLTDAETALDRFRRLLAEHG